MTDEPEAETNSVSFKVKTSLPSATGTDVWTQVQTILHIRDPELWASWFQHLSEAERIEGCVTLIAPSRFMAGYIAQKWTGRLLAAYSRIDPETRSVRIEAAE